MPSLTSHLLALDKKALKEATEHPFLEAAANGSLPRAKLQAWLGQDRLYQMAYVTFIGTMLSRINVPIGRDREETLTWRTTDLLIDSLTNIRDEIRMFEKTADDEGWLEEICDVPTELQTRAYQDLFAGATAQGRPFVVGLAVLWATEEAYLRAWRHARSKMPAGDDRTGTGKEDVMQRAFIPAWTSDEFEAFVRRIGGLVDEYGAYYGEGSFEWRECETALRSVLWAEREFWPKI